MAKVACGEDSMRRLGGPFSNLFAVTLPASESAAAVVQQHEPCCSTSALGECTLRRCGLVGAHRFSAVRSPVVCSNSALH